MIFVSQLNHSRFLCVAKGLFSFYHPLILPMSRNYPSDITGTNFFEHAERILSIDFAVKSFWLIFYILKLEPLIRTFDSHSLQTVGPYNYLTFLINSIIAYVWIYAEQRKNVRDIILLRCQHKPESVNHLGEIFSENLKILCLWRYVFLQCFHPIVKKYLESYNPKTLAVIRFLAHFHLLGSRIQDKVNRTYSDLYNKPPTVVPDC